MEFNKISLKNLAFIIFKVYNAKSKINMSERVEVIPLFILYIKEECFWQVLKKELKTC